MRAFQLKDSTVPPLIVGALSAFVAIVWVIPQWSRFPETRWDAPGHLLAIETIRDRFLPWPTGWEGRVFSGYAQGEFYPPFAHWLAAWIACIVPAGTAYRLVLSASVLLVPLASFVCARGFRMRGSQAATFAILATAILGSPKAVLHATYDLGSTFESGYHIGLFSGAVAVPIFLLGGAAFGRALCGRGSTLVAGLWLAAAVTNHLVGGIATAALFATASGARLLAGGGARATLMCAARIGGAALLASAWWFVPFLRGHRELRVSHIPSDAGPVLVLAFALVVPVLVMNHGSFRRLASRGGAFALLAAGLVAWMSLGDRLRATGHLYRLAPFVLLGLCGVVAAACDTRRSRVALGVLASAVLIATVPFVQERETVAPPPTIHMPPDLTTDDRILVATLLGHDHAPHFLEAEVVRRSPASALVGLFVESSPLSRWCLDLARTVAFDTYSWGVPVDSANTARLATALDDGGPLATSEEESRRLLAEIADRMALFGVTRVLTDRRLPAELVLGDAPVVCRIPFEGEVGGSEFEVDGGARVFRLHRVRQPPRLAQVVRAPLRPVEYTPDAWDRAVGEHLFTETPAEGWPVEERDGLDVTPAPPGASATATISGGGTRVQVDVTSDVPVPVLVSVGFHTAWQATDGDGRPIAVDRASPGFCLVRGMGRITLDRREGLARPLFIVPGLLIAVGIAGGVRRRRCG